MTEIFIIRHAIAEEREVFSLKGFDDSQRPLTKEGTTKFEKISKQLKKLIGSVDIIVSSPYVRAQQTVDILVHHYPHTHNFVSLSLLPNAEPNDFLNWSKEHFKKKDLKVLVVGHEPHLSKLACWMMYGGPKNSIEIKKGGCLKIRFDKVVGPSQGTLCWLVSPKCLGIK